MSDSFLNQIRTQKTKKIDIEHEPGTVTETDQPFFTSLILPSVDRLVWLGSQWERLKTDLHYVSKDTELTQGYRDAAKDLHSLLNSIEQEYEV